MNDRDSDSDRVEVTSAVPDTLRVSDDDTSPVRVPNETDHDAERDCVFVVDADIAFVTEAELEADSVVVIDS